MTHTRISLVSRLVLPIQFAVNWWSGLGAFRRALLMLVLARGTLSLLFMLDALPLELRDPKFRFYLYHGGDQEQFMHIAEDILSGQFHPQHIVAVGQALIMLPWIAILQPRNYYRLVAPLVVINGFIWASLSVWATGLLAHRVTRNERLALWSAGIWAMLPLLFYLSVFWHYAPATVRGAYVPTLAWLNGLSDGPAMLFLLLAVTILAKLPDQSEPPAFWPIAGAGLLLGVTVDFRFHYVPVVIALLGYIAVAYGWRNLGIASLSALVAYIPQAVYNQIVYRFPFTTGYFSKDYYNWGGVLKRPLADYLAHLPFTRDSLSRLWQYYIGERPWLVVPLVVFLIAGLIGLIGLWKQRGWKTVALGVGAPAAYLIPMMFTWTFRDAVLRFSMPVIPYAIIVALYAAWLLARLVERYWRQLSSIDVNEGTA